MKCKLGIHNWSGCQCPDCGKTRNEQHDWSENCEVCAKCGKTAKYQHDWTKDCEKCSKCGKTRENEHSWAHNCEKCSKCGKTRYDKHKMESGMCLICGHGEYTDLSDGKVYKVIKIGDQIIMAANYTKKPDEGNYWVYEDHEENKLTYGYLYDWETAKNIAPKGWHLPTKAEWERLFQAIGGDSKKDYEQLKVGGISDFEGILSGWRTTRGAYNGLGASAHYWCDTTEGEDQAWQFKLSAYQHKVEFEKGDKGLGLSVRLFKDK